MATQYVYTFGNGIAEGHQDMKIILGGKGANLAEMNRIGLPVPPGFTISTEACTQYFDNGRHEVLNQLHEQVRRGVTHLEKLTGKEFGNPDNPLLLSVRSGARVSMPGMMDTVLNLGLNAEVTEGFARQTGNPRLAWDSYRRFVQMYGSVVLGMKPLTKEDHDPFEEVIDALKAERSIKLDTDLGVDDLRELVSIFLERIQMQVGQTLPEDPEEQLWGSILAVFDSWMNMRAFQYRKLNHIPHDWGTAVNVQVMVFGNTGNDSATGVAFTRDPATGESLFTGEYLINAQGEDVVAGTRTPRQITLEGSRKWAGLAGISEEDRKLGYPSLEEVMPAQFAELDRVRHVLETHYREMQDLEFTIEKGKLWVLQTRTGKRTGAAMVRIGMDMLEEGLIDSSEAILRMEPAKLDELLHPVFEPQSVADAVEITHGLPASPGAASGQVVFFASDAEAWQVKGLEVILVRVETSPEDIQGMDSARGILTSRGGMTSHAAVVARGMGKCCVSGAGGLLIDYQKRQFTTADGVTINEGDWISLDGSSGKVYKDQLNTVEPEIGGHFRTLMKLSDSAARMKVLANADTPQDASTARAFGAQGIGLCRTEHMFFEKNRIRLVRQMILAHDTPERQQVLDQLLPIQRADFEGILDVMHDLPVTIRLLDPPLHEFLPQDEAGMKQMAKELRVPLSEVRNKVASLHETNPMLGHRGCRLGNTFPEITAMQTRAILEAAILLKSRGIHTHPHIMIPLTSMTSELKAQTEIIRKTATQIFEERGDTITYKVGTMIEIPRAVLIADQIAPLVDFFSFGTNDLTQMTFGFSRDDVGKFLPVYLEKGILTSDPFQTIDQEGVGKLVEVGLRHGKAANPDLKVGVCGEHGGDPASIVFFNRTGLDTVSCSPFRVPIARLVAAQAAFSNTTENE
jgi:pyruvate,orthophosphate dikinase